MVLDTLQDPGNVGTLIRSALAFNYDKIYVSESTVDIYNEKVIRASQGAIFKINVVKKELNDNHVIMTTSVYNQIFGTNYNKDNLSKSSSANLKPS